MSPRIEKAIHRPSGLHVGSSGPADTAGNMCRSSRSEWPYRFGRALVIVAPRTIPPAATPRASRCHGQKRIMSATAPRHPERADPRRVAGGSLLQVIADVPDRAVIARVDRRLGVVLPAKRVRLRGLSLDEHRLPKGEVAEGIVRETPGEALP